MCQKDARERPIKSNRFTVLQRLYPLLAHVSLQCVVVSIILQMLVSIAQHNTGRGHRLKVGEHCTTQLRHCTTQLRHCTTQSRHWTTQSRHCTTQSRHCTTQSRHCTTEEQQCTVFGGCPQADLIIHKG